MEYYKHDDLSDEIEIKKMAIHQLEQIEMNIWTDNIDEAFKRTVDMHLLLVNLTRKQSAKRIENVVNQLKLHNAGFHIINFGHKKAD